MDLIKKYQSSLNHCHLKMAQALMLPPNVLSGEEGSSLQASIVNFTERLISDLRIKETQELREQPRLEAAEISSDRLGELLLTIEPKNSCGGCKYYSGNRHLICAIHPEGSDGDCRDWEE